MIRLEKGIVNNVYLPTSLPSVDGMIFILEYEGVKKELTILNLSMYPLRYIKFTVSIEFLADFVKGDGKYSVTDNEGNVLNSGIARIIDNTVTSINDISVINYG